jgi:hypothetical protein
LGATIVDEKDPTDLGLSPPPPQRRHPPPIDHKVNRDGAAAVRAELERARRAREGGEPE